MKTLTRRQKKFVSNIKNKKCKTLSAAARDAGYSKNTPNKMLEQTVRSVLGKYLQALEDAGATDELSAKVIVQGMKAERKIVLKGGEGEPVELMAEPDHATRLKANEQFLKVKKLLTVNIEAEISPVKFEFYLPENNGKVLGAHVNGNGSGHPVAAASGASRIVS